MSRLTPTFARLKTTGRTALIPYLMAGHPHADITPSLLHALVAAGADVIELGMPFSDAMADGPVIQQAADQARAAGVGLVQVLGMVREFRQQDRHTPLVLMGYANPVERYNQNHPSPDGQSAFVQDAAQAGVDGVLIVDYPPEECQGFAAQAKNLGLDLIFLLAPTSSQARIQQVAQLASGYVYYVSLKGVSGSLAIDTAAVAAMLPRLRAHIQVPIGVGFGIRDAATAQRVAQVADAVVIGSKLIELMDCQAPAQAIALAQAFLRDVRQALDASSVSTPEPLP